MWEIVLFIFFLKHERNGIYISATNDYYTNFRFFKTIINQRIPIYNIYNIMNFKYILVYSISADSIHVLMHLERPCTCRIIKCGTSILFLCMIKYYMTWNHVIYGEDNKIKSTSIVTRWTKLVFQFKQVYVT